MLLFADKPGPPKNLEYPEKTASTVTLKWKKPDDDGGTEITGILIYLYQPLTAKSVSVMHLILLIHYQQEVFGHLGSSKNKMVFILYQ